MSFPHAEESRETGPKNLQLGDVPTPGQERRHDRDGTALLYVPAGTYSLGANDLGETEAPVHRVRLGGFWIAKHPVTNEQYHRFLGANPGYRKPAFWGEEFFNQPEQPVVGVSWEDAKAYCHWAGLVLPSEARWEAAARGKEGRRFPWGDDEPRRELANFSSFEGQTTPVGRFPDGAGPFGTHDQAGNVSEWCEDVFDDEAYHHRQNGEVDPVITSDEPLFRSLRGGSWLDQGFHLVAAARLRYWARLRRRFVGFRCALPFETT